MDPRFRTTRWSVVVDAGAGGDVAREALAELCQAYWYPLYAFARRRGAAPADAADLVQGYFTWLLDGDRLAVVDPDRGRFRGFLATSFTRFANDERKRAAAAKRGGDVRHVRIDGERGETRYRLEPADASLSPERLFERRWALDLLDRVFTALRDEAEEAGNGASFAELAVFLGGVSPTPTHAEVAERLGRTTGAVKVAVHRMRGRYRELLRAAVRETVRSDDDVADEIRRLIDAVRR